MSVALPIRDDIPAAELRRLARLEADGRVACWLLALANALDGMSRAQAAEQTGLGRRRRPLPRRRRIGFADAGSPNAAGPSMPAGIGPFGAGSAACRGRWVVRFNAAAVEGLCDRPRSGRPAFLDDGKLATLKALPRAAARGRFAEGSIGCGRSMGAPGAGAGARRPQQLDRQGSRPVVAEDAPRAPAGRPPMPRRL
jgi:hypothetical protein